MRSIMLLLVSSWTLYLTACSSGDPAEINAGDVAAGDVEAGDVEASGPITITGDVVAGGVQAGGVEAGLVSAGDVQAGVVTAGNVLASDVAAGDVYAGDVAAGVVSAGVVSAGAVTAGEVTAGDVEATGEVTITGTINAASGMGFNVPAETVELVLSDVFLRNGSNGNWTRLGGSDLLTTAELGAEWTGLLQGACGGSGGTVVDARVPAGSSGSLQLFAVVSCQVP